MRSMEIAATGMLAQEMNVEVISNNIANVNTTAFKRSRVEFQDLLYQDLRTVGANSSEQGTIVPTGAQIGVGVQAAAVYRMNDQGSLTETSNSLDLAIQGRGYFQVQIPGGQTAYTRDGSFQLSPTGEMVTADGFVVMPGITLPSNTVSVTVNQNGQVLAQVAGQAAQTTVGQFELATFPNEAGLANIGSNLLQQTAASGAPVTGIPGNTDFGTMQQGFLETSNVNVVTEMTNLITAQRAYEMNSKVVQVSDQMSATLNNFR